MNPDVWVPIVLPSVQKGQHVGPILALAQLIKGSSKERLEEHLPQICLIMSDPDTCASSQVSQSPCMDGGRGVPQCLSLFGFFSGGCTDESDGLCGGSAVPLQVWYSRTHTNFI